MIAKSKAQRAAVSAEALQRATEGQSTANYDAIFSGFRGMGIAEAEIIPRENVFTYEAWKAKGRQVRRGEHGVRVHTVIPCTIREEDPDTGEKTEKKVEKKRRATVFHISQTRAIGDPEPTPTPGSPTPEPKPAPRRKAKASPDRLRSIAATARKLAEDKFRRRPTHTPKKLCQARSAVLDGIRLTRLVNYAEAIAEAIEADTLPGVLLDFAATKGDLEAVALQTCEQVPNGYHPYSTETGEWRWKSPVADAVRALADDPEESARQQAEAERVRLEDGVRFRDIPGFFPTPPALVEKMIDAAELDAGHEVLEPSAGKGDIAAAIRSHGVAQLELVEINGQLCKLLRAKGFEPHETDFLKLAGADFDRVIMNPPFEKGQDVDHIRHAFDCLAPGGRLVAICSEGPFFRKDRRSAEFRCWLEHHRTRTEKLPAAFSGRESFRQTGVATRMVVIDREADPCEN